MNASRALKSSSLLVAGLLVGLLLAPLMTGIASAAAWAAQGNCRHFSQTGFQVCGRFLQYWDANGGLAQQGYPLTNEFQEVSQTDGKTYTVQYFQRAVFELHPENQAPYDVLLSLLGKFELERRHPEMVGGGSSAGELITVPQGNGSNPAGLKYQPDIPCVRVANAMEFPSCILQRVQSGELTGEQAVVMIQMLASKYGAHTDEGDVLTLPNLQPGLFWCPGGVEEPYPPDSAFPLAGTAGAHWAKTLFVVDRGTGGPDRIIDGADHAPCWMVYRR